MSENKEFKVEWLDDDESLVKITGTNEQGQIVWETAMHAPDYAKLYYALKEWFND